MSSLRRNALTTLLALFAALLVLTGAGRGDHISELRLNVGHAEQDFIHWHLTNFMDKWVHLALRPIQGIPTREDQREAIREFFDLGVDLRRHRTELERALALPPEERTIDPEHLQTVIENIEARRAVLQPGVLEAMESAISQAADEMGIIDRFGPIRWPPVNFTFEPNSLVLVRSPRDAVVRLDDMMLRSDITPLEQIALEDTVEADAPTSALVVRVGGIATYPAQVTPNASLHTTLVVASHEWLHHWMFFRPLGKRWWDGGEMTLINETVADIVGEELGDRAYELITGQAVHREPWKPPELYPVEEPHPGVFDYRREMRLTRIHLEQLLAQGLVEEAEAYLEERRLEFVANGWNIRKLNTAWFAFHGSYGRSPGTISPMETQLRMIRAESGSLAAFLDLVSDITHPGQLEVMARQAGWTPPEEAGSR